METAVLSSIIGAVGSVGFAFAFLLRHLKRVKCCSGCFKMQTTLEDGDRHSMDESRTKEEEKAD